MNTINVENCKTLLIGRRGENEVTTVAFDFTEWASEFGSGVVDLYVKRFGDDSAYPVVLTIDGTVASWLVTETDTNVAGYGKAEYVYRVDGKIAKSAVFPFFVAEDIGQPASEPPDPYESWLEQLTALGAETEAHAQAAEQSAEDAAESAQQAAGSATSAEGYAGQAETAAGLAQAAQTASEAARDAAQTAQASAESSATAASGSAASAAGSATAAADSASDASASASAAGASASAASASATTASNAATAAQAAQSAAEDAAEDAQQAAQQAHVEYEQLSGEVDDLSDEVAQQKSAIEALDSLVDRKAGMLVDSVSGSIASFIPDATIDNLLGLTVDIEPVQDLHGYDHPWPGGGNVQLLDIPDMPETTRNGVTYRIQNGVIYANGTCTDGFTPFPYMSVDFASDSYTFSVQLLSGSTSSVNNSFNGYDSGNNRTWLIPFGAGTYPVNDTKTADIRIIGVAFNNGAVFNNAALAFQVEIGSEMSTFRPYSNECPISGWDSVEVEATGENLLPYPPPKSAASRTETFNPETCFFLKAGTYTFAFDRFDNATSWRFGIVLFDARKERYYVPSEILGNDFGHNDSGRYYVNGSNRTDTVFSLTMPFDGFIRLFFLLGDTTDASVCVNPRICIGTTASPYKPYAGNRYTIALGDTVYGAKLTIAEDGSVKALVDRVAVMLDGTQTGVLENWMPKPGLSGWLYPYSLTNNFIYQADTVIPAGLSCDTLPAITYNSAFSGTTIGISIVSGSSIWGLCVRYPGENYRTLADINALLSANPMRVVYKLAAPIEIQLDPMTIATISGQTNNVWADAGDVSVVFAADLKHYIDSKIAAAVAALS